MSSITTHVLDTARGSPAAGIPVVLEVRDATWKVLGKGTTDAYGRLKELLPSNFVLAPGVYRLTFDTAAYFSSQGVEGFFPEVAVVFIVREPSQRYHVPVLLSPYSYTTYRGS